MRTSVLVILLLTFLLVSDSEEGWVRKSFRKIGRGFRNVGKSIRRVAHFIRKNERNIKIGVAAARLIGKRSAELPCPPDNDDDGMDQQTAAKQLKKLQLECPQFRLQGQKLSKATVIQGFDAVDDGDGSLTEAELTEFENVLEAFQVCSGEADVKEE